MAKQDVELIEYKGWVAMVDKRTKDNPKEVARIMESLKKVYDLDNQPR